MQTEQASFMLADCSVTTTRYALGQRARQRRRLLFGLLFVLISAFACEGPSQENGFAGDPAVWPQAARLGNSVGWFLSSEVLAGPQAAPLPSLAWSRDNIEIGLIDPQGYETVLIPRAVFEAQSALSSQVRGSTPGANIGALIALFDLPDPWPNPAQPNPSTLELALYVDGELIENWTNRIEILGGGGTTTNFALADSLELLESAPMLRLRPRWNPNSLQGIDPDWLIAGIEFTLSFPVASNGGISNPRAVPTGDAATALTLTGPVTQEGSTQRVRVHLVVPSGFRLLHSGGDDSGCYAGRTALIEIVLDKASGSTTSGTPVFSPEDFEVSDLKIVDPNGVRLNPSLYGNAYFDHFVVNNLSEGL